MNRSLKTATTTALLCASSVALAELTPCDVEVTRERNREEMACQMQYGPPSGKWHVSNTEVLDRCLENAYTRYKLDRWQCHGVSFPQVRYPED